MAEYGFEPQLSLDIDAAPRGYPDKSFDEDLLRQYLIKANLDSYDCEYEGWEIEGSTAQLNYLSHGFFRFFGKFPPPVARRFIKELHDPGTGPVIDPMVGSGTTLVESMILGRQAVGLDVNPMAQLIAKVKTTPLSDRKIFSALEAYRRFWEAPTNPDWLKYVPDDRYVDHWFYPEAQQGLACTRLFIEECLEDEDIKDLFMVALGAVVRRLSRASNGMGRMFLDPAKPPRNIQDLMVKKVTEMSRACGQLYSLNTRAEVMLHDAKEPFLQAEMTNLVICHPPYFNLYKYSSIYKYEMLWLGFDNKDTRKREVREGFKIGKKELVVGYVEDLTTVLRNVARVLVRGGWCVLMMGDTVLREERVNTTALTIERITKAQVGLKLRRMILRSPKFTEASYAATQRRTTEDIGATFQDHILILEKVGS